MKFDKTRRKTNRPRNKSQNDKSKVYVNFYLKVEYLKQKKDGLFDDNSFSILN